MELIYSSLFFLLAFAFYKLRKNLLYPPTLLCLVWGGSLLAIWGLGDYFFDISLITLSIYLVGAIFFCVGHLFGETVIKYNSGQKNRIARFEFTYRDEKRTGIFITIVFLFLVVTLPVYYFSLSGSLGFSIFDIRTFFLQVRRADLSGSLNLGILMRNLIPVSLFLSLYIFNIHKKYNKFKKRTYLIVFVSVLLQLLTGGRAGAVYLLIAIVFLDMFRDNRINFRKIIIYVALLLSVMIFIAYSVGKGEVNNSLSLIENFDAFYKDIIFYLLGGVVAFNNIVIYPGSISSNGGVLRFFLQTAETLGVNVDVPNLHMQYSEIGSGLVTNVYTIYSAYYIDYGLIGVILLMFVYGFTVYLIYKKAKNGSNIYSSLYAYFIAGLVLSIYSEHFVMDLNYVIKLLLVLGIIEFIRRVRVKASNRR